MLRGKGICHQAWRPKFNSLELISIVGEIVLWLPSTSAPRCACVHTCMQECVCLHSCEDQKRALDPPGAGVTELWAAYQGHWVLNLGPLEKWYLALSPPSPLTKVSYINVQNLAKAQLICTSSIHSINSLWDLKWNCPRKCGSCLYGTWDVAEKTDME